MLKQRVMLVEIEPLTNFKEERHRICSLVIIGRYGSMQRLADQMGVSRALVSATIGGTHYNSRIARELAVLTGIPLETLFPGKTGVETRRWNRKKGPRHG